MLRVWSASGQELVTSPTHEFFDVVDIKRQLRAQYSYPICLQQLMEFDSFVEPCPGTPLQGPMEFQLVVLAALLPTRPEQRTQAADELVGYAAKRGHVDVARALLDAGAEREWQDGADDKTALAQASFRGHVALVRLLLESGADTRSADRLGRTALMHAADLGYVEVVQLLLEAKAATNTQDKRGQTALMYASNRTGPEAARLLLKDVEGRSARDGDGTGPCDIVRLLLDAHADVTLRDSRGRTALMHASSSGACKSPAA